MSAITTSRSTYLLSVGDGESADYVQLSVEPDGFIADPPGMNATSRDVQLAVTLHAESADALWSQVQAIERKLQQARALARPQSGGSGVTLGVRIQTTDMVYFDVLSGTFSIDGRLPSGRTLTGTIQLTCLPYARGSATTVSFTDQTNYSELWVPSVPGDVEALARVTITDKSTNSQVINRVRLSRRSGWNLGETDFDPVVKLASTGSGSDDSDDSHDDYHESSYARVTTSDQWGTLCYADQPNTDTVGEIDLLARLRDSSPVLSPPRGIKTSVTDGISLRQSVYKTDIRGTNSISRAWPSPTKEGHGLTMVLWMRNTNYDATVTVPSGWVNAVDTENASASCRVLIYYYENSPARSNEEVTFDATVDAVKISLVEWTGLTTSGMLDVTATNNETSATSHPTGTTTTTAQANAIGLTGHLLTTQGHFASYTGGWTAISTGRFYSAYQVFSVTGTKSATLSTDANVDSTNTIAVFKGSESSPAELPAGSYTYQVVPYDSDDNRGDPSDPINVRLANIGAVSLEWNAVTNASGYYVYWKRDANSWQRLDAGDTTSFNHTTETGAVTEDPDSDLKGALVRAQVCSGTTGEVLRSFDPVRLSVSRDRWEDVLLIRGANLPPHLALDGGDVDDWRVELQARHDTLPGETVDADVLMLIPHDEAQVELRYVDSSGVEMGNDTQRKWRYDLRRDLRSSAVLLDTSDDSVVARLRHQGRFLLHPGGNQMLPSVAVENGEADMEDALFDVDVRYVPRYRFLSGA